MFGNEGHFYLYISNVGTNDVSFMHFESSDNLNRNNDINCSSFSLLDIEGSDFPELSAEDYEGDKNLIPVSDCYDHIGSSESVKNTGEIDTISPLVSVGSIQKRVSLREGETCILKVKIKNNPLEPSCYPSTLDYDNWYNNNLSIDLYKFMNYAEVEEVQALPFSPLVDIKSLLALPKPSLAGSNLGQTIEFSTTMVIKCCHDRNIFGEELLITKRMSFQVP